MDNIIGLLGFSLLFIGPFAIIYFMVTHKMPKAESGDFVEYDRWGHIVKITKKVK